MSKPCFLRKCDVPAKWHVQYRRAIVADMPYGGGTTDVVSAPQGDCLDACGEHIGDAALILADRAPWPVPEHCHIALRQIVAPRSDVLAFSGKRLGELWESIAAGMDITLKGTS